MDRVNGSCENGSDWRDESKLAYALSVVLVGFHLPIFSYLTLIYRELGRMTTAASMNIWRFLKRRSNQN